MPNQRRCHPRAAHPRYFVRSFVRSCAPATTATTNQL